MIPEENNIPDIGIKPWPSLSKHLKASLMSSSISSSWISLFRKLINLYTQKNEKRGLGFIFEKYLHYNDLIAKAPDYTKCVGLGMWHLSVYNRFNALEVWKYLWLTVRIKVRKTNKSYSTKVYEALPHYFSYIPL